MNARLAGAAVEARKDELKLSGRSAARLAGVSASTWSDLEGGKYPPNLNTQRGVAKALRWPIDWWDTLMAGETPVPVVDTVSDTERLDKLEARLTQQDEQIRRLSELVRRLTANQMDDYEQHADDASRADQASD